MIGEAKAIVPTPIGIPVSRMNHALLRHAREGVLVLQWRARTGKTEIEKILGNEHQDIEEPDGSTVPANDGIGCHERKHDRTDAIIDDAKEGIQKVRKSLFEEPACFMPVDAPAAGPGAARRTPSKRGR